MQAATTTTTKPQGNDGFSFSLVSLKRTKSKMKRLNSISRQSRYRQNSANALMELLIFFLSLMSTTFIQRARTHQFRNTVILHDCKLSVDGRRCVRSNVNRNEPLTFSSHFAIIFHSILLHFVHQCGMGS